MTRSRSDSNIPTSFRSFSRPSPWMISPGNGAGVAPMLGATGPSPAPALGGTTVPSAAARAARKGCK